MTASTYQSGAVAVMAVPGVIYNPENSSLNKGPFQATGFWAGFSGENFSCTDYLTCKEFNNQYS